MLFCVSLFVFYVPRELPYSEVFPTSKVVFLLFRSLAFPGELFPGRTGLLVLLFSEGSVVFRLAYFADESLPRGCKVIVVSLL